MKIFLLLILLAGETALFWAIGALSIDWEYIRSFLAQSGPVLVLAAGMTMVLMTAGIDLSVGATTALVACVMASFGDGPGFWLTALPVGLALALTLGFTNGALIAWLDIPPIIATLGTMILFRGLCYVVMGNLEKGPFFGVEGYAWLGEHWAALILVVLVYGAGGFLFYRSRWRREVLMLGGNRVAARYAGIPVPRRICQVYTLVGAFAFLAAVAYTARNGSVSASALTGLELQVIVAVVLGGTRVDGGVGSLAGSFLGVLIIAVLDEGLRGAKSWGDEHLHFQVSHLRYLTLGGLLVVGVWLNTRFGRRAG